MSLLQEIEKYGLAVCEQNKKYFNLNEERLNMSTMSQIYEINFDGKKPNKNQIMKKIKIAIQAGAAAITITWGENWIELDYSFNARAWNGNGWIKDISGDDIAQELTRDDHRKTLNLYNT